MLRNCVTNCFFIYILSDGTNQTTRAKENTFGFGKCQRKGSQIIIIIIILKKECIT